MQEGQETPAGSSSLFTNEENPYSLGMKWKQLRTAVPMALVNSTDRRDQDWTTNQNYFLGRSPQLNQTRCNRSQSSYNLRPWDMISGQHWELIRTSENALLRPHPYHYGIGFPCSSVSKESACSAADLVRSLGWEDPLEKEMATHSSILAWKISWTEEPCGLQSMGLQRAGHNWATNIKYRSFK